MLDRQFTPLNPCFLSFLLVILRVCLSFLSLPAFHLFIWLRLQHIAQAIGRQEVLEKPRNVRKFVGISFFLLYLFVCFYRPLLLDTLVNLSEQSWQLVVHVSFTIAEYLVLAENNFEWWNDTPKCWTDSEISPLTRRVYVFQLSVWFYTAYRHRFVDALHKDYFVM